MNQYNGYNYTDVMLSGVNNSVLLNQTGGNNSASFGLNGVNNRFTLTQDGGDRLQMQGLQQANTRLEITQGIGNNTLTIDNTSLFQNANGAGIPNLRIEQSGGAQPRFRTDAYLETNVMKKLRRLLIVGLDAVKRCRLAQDPELEGKLEEEYVNETVVAEEGTETLLLDNTRSKIGRDFYEAFFRHYVELPKAISPTALADSTVKITPES